METAQISLNIVVALHEGIIVWGTLVVFPVDGLGNGTSTIEESILLFTLFLYCLFISKKAEILYTLLRYPAENYRAIYPTV